MRTTVEIPDELYRKAKVQAAYRGIRLRDLIEEGLRRVLTSEPGFIERPRRVAFPLLRSRRRGSLSADDVTRAEDQTIREEDSERGRAV
jgi:hypothetical protein